jgi:RimJ/RimL family protein N-acetyltransferase
MVRPSPSIPELETERLSLRGHSMADLPDSVALWSDLGVTRHVGGRAFSAEETWSRLLRNLGHWALLGYGYWVVRERATGRFVGEVGLIDLHREVEPGFDGAPEAGWVLASWCHGRGFATEAVSAVIDWSSATVAAPRLVCMIDSENLASARVAMKTGFSEYARSWYRQKPVVLWQRIAAT